MAKDMEAKRRRRILRSETRRLNKMKGKTECGDVGRGRDKAGPEGGEAMPYGARG